MSEQPDADAIEDGQYQGLGEADDALLSKFEDWARRLDAHWGEWQAEARDDYAFVAGDQWAEDDRDQMLEDQRIPVVFNLTAPTLDAVSGAEIQNRQQVQFFPREVGDAGVSDVLTQAGEYINDECNGDQEDSEVFRDALTCGVGCSEMRPEVEADQVSLICERVDPLEMAVDPASRKACFEDARYLRRQIPMSPDDFEEFKESIGKPEAEASGSLSDMSRPTIVDPSNRYKSGMLGADPDDVIVEEWQWYEREPVHLTAIPQQDGTTKLQSLTPEQHGQAQQIAKEGGIGQLKSRRTTQKCYYRAFVGAGELLLHEKIHAGSFTYKFITGKRDRNRKTWFGLVRAMKDPQRFSNKLYSLIIDIVRANAKGGVMMEEGAVGDVREFESTYSSVSEITWLPNGTLSNAGGPKIMPKVAPPVPQSLFQLMEWAKDMVRATTGVNEEILGLANRDQAGVLESQRKQAAYGILSPFFDAQRRYLRGKGKLMLAMMREFLPPDKMLRIVEDGVKKYVTMAMLPDTGEYDIVIDEAPAGPNQKARNMGVLTSLMPWLSNADLDAEFWSDAAMYTDFSTAFTEKLSAAFKRKGELEQAQAQAEKPMADAHAQAALEETASKAELNRAKSFEAVSNAHDTNVQLGAAFLATNGQIGPQDAQQPPQDPNAPPPGQPGGQPGQQPPGQPSDAAPAPVQPPPQQPMGQQ